MAAHERALASASSLVALQAASRLVTFALNQALMRLASPAAFGTVAIQLELLLNTILFFAREGIRGAVLRSASENAEGQRHDRIVRTTFVPLLMGLPLCVTGCALYVGFADASVAAQPHFISTVLAYGLAALIELASEPAFLLSQIALDSRTRVRAEGSAVIARAIVTVSCLYVAGETVALAAFAGGQLSYAATLLAILAFKYGQPALDAAKRSSQLDESTKRLAIALTKQSLVKQVLQEGDKFAVSRLSTVDDQGAYAVALNYGSLVVRIIFQPIEEAARLYFSRAVGERASKKDLEQATSALRALVHLHLLLALAALSFAPPYVPLLCHLLLGRRWRGTAAAQLLRDYVHLLPLLGLNGVLEAFVHSTASQEELASSSTALFIASSLFAGACYAFSSLGGARATMVGTGLGMAYRIVWSARFTSRKLGGYQTWCSPPRLRVIIAFAMASALLRFFEPASMQVSLRLLAIHIVIGGVSLLAVSIIRRVLAHRLVTRAKAESSWPSERQELRRIKQTFSRKRDQ